MKKTITDLFKKDDFIKKGTIVFIATGITGICNLAYHLFMVRFLTPADYGIFNSLTAVLIFITQPAATIYIVFTKFQSEYFSLNKIDKAKHFILHLGKRIVAIALSLLILTLFFSYWIANFMQIKNQILIMLIGILVFPSLMLPLFFGVLSGFQKFYKLGLFISIKSLLMLITGVLAVLSGFGLIGIFTSWILVQIFILIVLVSFILKILTGNYSFSYKKLLNIFSTKEMIKSVNFKRIYSYFLSVASLSFTFLGIIYINMILAKHFFTPEKAGFYSIAQTIGKITLFLPIAFSLVMFSKCSASFAKGEYKIDMLKKTLLATGLISGVAMIITMSFPRYIIRLISGSYYPQCIPLVRLFSVGMWLFSLSYVMYNYNLATERFNYLKSLLFLLLLEIVLIFIFHDSLILILWILNIIAFLTFIVTIIYTFKKNKLKNKNIQNIK